MLRRLLPPGLGLLLLVLLSPGAARGAGYTFHRILIWGRTGELPPRFQQETGPGTFSLLFPGPAPESGWDPVPARRLVVHGGAFLAADPVPILRPRDPDPDWNTGSLEASLDLNRDAQAEVVRARTVMIPDRLDPSAGLQRVLVEVREGDRVLFADRLEGPASGSVRAHSVTSTDFTGEGFPDLIVYLEAENRTGVAFYSQTRLRYAGEATRQIEGFSPDFQWDGYGIFDLNRRPRDFFSRLPASARTDQPGCPTARGVQGDGLAHCRYSFATPYLGWIREFRVAFVPHRSISAIDLYFPAGGTALTPEQALDFLVPVFGGEFQLESRARDGGEKDWTWRWKGKQAVALLHAVESGGRRESVSLKLERPR